jgi:2,4-dienoyl-CoA reductase [(3E)-enoyl-CoA-producing], peroxisomal
MPAVEPAPSPFHSDLFAGQVALVTGGGTGIGREICRSLGQHGARIAIVSRKQEVLDATAAELRGEGIDVWVRSCDVRDAVGVRAAIEALVEHYRRLDIVVNNAAGNFPAPMSRISPNGFKSVVDIDLLGTYNVSRAAFDVWLEAHGGNIVNITAPFEMKGAAWQSHVAAAKAGVDSLTRTCAVEWGAHGIRVNAIAPGPIASTEGMRRFAAAVPGSDSAGRESETVERPSRPRNPLGLIGHGSDIAHMLMYFCSPAGRFVSGQVIAVDGAGSVDQLKIDASGMAAMGAR